MNIKKLINLIYIIINKFFSYIGLLFILYPLFLLLFLVYKFVAIFTQGPFFVKNNIMMKSSLFGDEFIKNDLFNVSHVGNIYRPNLIFKKIDDFFIMKERSILSSHLIFNDQFNITKRFLVYFFSKNLVNPDKSANIFFYILSRSFKSYFSTIYLLFKIFSMSQIFNIYFQFMKFYLKYIFNNLRINLIFKFCYNFMFNNIILFKNYVKKFFFFNSFNLYNFFFFFFRFIFFIFSSTLIIFFYIFSIFKIFIFSLNILKYLEKNKLDYKIFSKFSNSDIFYKNIFLHRILNKNFLIKNLFLIIYDIYSLKNNKKTLNLNQNFVNLKHWFHLIKFIFSKLSIIFFKFFISFFLLNKKNFFFDKWKKIFILILYFLSFIISLIFVFILFNFIYINFLNFLIFFVLMIFFFLIFKNIRLEFKRCFYLYILFFWKIKKRKNIGKKKSSFISAWNNFIKNKIYFKFYGIAHPFSYKIKENLYESVKKKYDSFFESIKKKDEDYLKSFNNSKNKDNKRPISEEERLETEEREKEFKKYEAFVKLSDFNIKKLDFFYYFLFFEDNLTKDLLNELDTEKMEYSYVSLKNELFFFSDKIFYYYNLVINFKNFLLLKNYVKIKNLKFILDIIFIKNFKFILMIFFFFKASYISFFRFFNYDFINSLLYNFFNFFYKNFYFLKIIIISFFMLKRFVLYIIKILFYFNFKLFFFNIMKLFFIFLLNFEFFFYLIFYYIFFFFYLTFPLFKFVKKISLVFLNLFIIIFISLLLLLFLIFYFFFYFTYKFSFHKFLKYRVKGILNIFSIFFTFINDKKYIDLNYLKINLYNTFLTSKKNLIINLSKQFSKLKDIVSFSVYDKNFVHFYFTEFLLKRFYLRNKLLSLKGLVDSNITSWFNNYQINLNLIKNFDKTFYQSTFNIRNNQISFETTKLLFLKKMNNLSKFLFNKYFYTYFIIFSIITFYYFLFTNLFIIYKIVFFYLFFYYSIPILLSIFIFYYKIKIDNIFIGGRSYFFKPQTYYLKGSDKVYNFLKESYFLYLFNYKTVFFHIRILALNSFVLYLLYNILLFFYNKLSFFIYNLLKSFYNDIFLTNEVCNFFSFFILFLIIIFFNKLLYKKFLFFLLLEKKDKILSFFFLSQTLLISGLFLLNFFFSFVFSKQLQQYINIFEKNFNSCFLNKNTSKIKITLTDLEDQLKFIYLLRSLENRIFKKVFINRNK
jgi:hypothetical protein